LLEVRERLRVVSGERMAARSEVMEAPVAVAAGCALLEELERALHVAAVLLEDGGVVELLRLRRRRAAALPVPAGGEVHPPAAHDLLLVGMLLAQVLEPRSRLVETPLVEELDRALVVLLRRRELADGLTH